MCNAFSYFANRVGDGLSTEKKGHLIMINIFRAAVHDDCTTREGVNTGCGVRYGDARSYGPDLNKNGGGWYVSMLTAALPNLHPRNQVCRGAYR
jgi:hypothetical protein